MTKTRDLADLGGGFIQAGSGAEQRTVESKLQDVVSVLDFIPESEHAAIKAGTSSYDAGPNISAAINAADIVTFSPGTYLINTTVTIAKSVTLQLNGSTITRTADPGPKIFVVTGGTRFEMFGGTIDGNNTPDNRAMLVDINASNSDVWLEGVTFKNNCAFDSPNVPTKSQDTDHVNVQRCKTLRVNGCTFDLASRQAISVTNAVPYSEITNNRISNCYLFGIDYEANSATLNMWDTIIVRGNQFVNNGVKDGPAGNYVWNSGGAFQIAYPTDQSLKVAKTVVFSGNTIVNTDFTTPDVSFIEPNLKINQFETLDFSNNKIDTLDYIGIGILQTHLSDVVTFTGNTIVSNGLTSYVIIEDTSSVVVDSNTLRTFEIRSGSSNVTGNTFTVNGLTLTSSISSSTVTGNNFVSSSGTAIDLSAAPSNSVQVSGNYYGAGATTYSGQPGKTLLVGPTENYGISTDAHNKLLSPNIQPSSGSRPMLFDGVRYYDTASLGTVLTIPVTSQTSRWYRHTIELWWFSMESNTNSSDAGYLLFGVGTKNSISGITILNSAGTFSSIGFSGMNLLLTLTTGMTGGTQNGLGVYYRILSETPWYIQMSNATFN